jgi:hypothetical protein
MMVSPTGLGLSRTPDAVNEPIPQPSPATPPAEAASTEVLISTQTVLFGTAAAQQTRRENIRRRLATAMRHLFSTSTDESRPQQRHYPVEYGFLQDARMAREMERL